MWYLIILKAAITYPYIALICIIAGFKLKFLFKIKILKLIKFIKIFK